MGEQDNVKALKRLAVALIGNGLTEDEVEGETVADVINYIADNYNAQG